MIVIFNVEVNKINYQLKVIFETHELEDNRTVPIELTFYIKKDNKEGDRNIYEKSFSNWSDRIFRKIFN